MRAPFGNGVQLCSPGRLHLEFCRCTLGGVDGGGVDEGLVALDIDHDLVTADGADALRVAAESVVMSTPASLAASTFFSNR